MIGTGPAQSPFQWNATDLNGSHLVMTVPFDNDTRAILDGTTVVRDPGCLFSTIILGVGPDGSPETSPDQFTVADGSTLTLSAADMAGKGLFTAEDVLALQITAVV